MCSGKQVLMMLALVAACLGAAEYDIFPGFELNTLENDSAADGFSYQNTFLDQNVQSMFAGIPAATTSATSTNGQPDNDILSKYKERKRNKYRMARARNIIKSSCPEEERPSNIGAYEVPTQLDMVSYARSTVRRIFKRYQLKTIIFLDDIQQAIRATSGLEGKCVQRAVYRRCVNMVDAISKDVAKTHVSSVEGIRHDVNLINEESICNLTSMKQDPMKLIERLTVQDATLEFALPGFLRLLSTCSIYCSAPTTSMKKEKAFVSIAEDPAIRRFLDPVQTNKIRTFLKK